MTQDDAYAVIGKVNSNPTIYPIASLLGGMLLWVIDAMIDVYLLGEEQSLLENIYSPEPTEFWMRMLVLVVLMSMGLQSRRTILKHQRLDSLLINYQKKLEGQVEEKTQELQVKNSVLEELATKDPLTGLYNRRYFLEALNEELTRFARYGRPYCLHLLDIDHFKKINDLHGHYIGDAVLNEFSQQILSALRKGDCLARWGGEEFILLTPETDIDEAIMLAEKLNRRIAEYAFGDIGQITVSIGVASAIADESREALIRRADQALYNAKKLGRDRVDVAPDESNPDESNPGVQL